MKIFIVLSESPLKIRKIAVYHFLIGTLRNHDMATGRRLLLRHLITTSCEKESLYLISTQVIKTATETCVEALCKWAEIETEYNGS